MISPALNFVFKQNPGEIAAIILEPIMMNVGLCMPQRGFLEEPAREIATKNGALLIFDEVKDGGRNCQEAGAEPRSTLVSSPT